MRLYTKFILLIGAVALGLGLISSFLVSRMMHKAMDLNLRNEAVMAAQTLAEHITHSVIDGEVVPAYEATMKIRDRLETIEYVCVVDFDGRLFVHTFEGGFPKAFASRLNEHVPVDAADPEIVEYVTDTGRILDISIPLITGMKAHIHIGMSEAQSQAQIASLRNRIIGLSLVLAIAGIAIGAIVSRKLTGPLVRMAGSMRDFGERKREKEIDFAGGGREIADLTVAFNQMISDRKQAEQTLRKSEAQFRGLVESSSDWIWETNTEGAYTYVSPKVEAILGYKPQEIIGKTPFDLMPPKEAEQIAVVFKECVETGKPIVTIENINLHKDGRRVVLETSGVPVFDDAGEVIGYRGVDRDITERKQHDEERERAREFMQTVIDAFPEAMMVINRDYTIALANRTVREIAGGKDLVTDRLKCHQISHGSATPCNCDRHLCPMKAVIETKVPVTLEHIHYNAQGREIIVELTAAPIFDEKGEVVQIIEWSHDITERKRAEKEIENISKFPSENPNPVIRIRADGVILYANDAAGNVLKVWSAGIGEIVSKDWMHEISNALEANSSILKEEMITDRLISFEIAPVLELEYVNLYGRDITERKRAEEALQESETRYRELVDNMSSGVAVYEAVDNGKNFVFKNLNRAGERINKSKKEDVVGKKITEMFPGVEEFGLLDVFRRVYKTGKPEHHPVTMYKDNKYFAWFDNYVYKLPSGEIVAVHDDITERKHAEQEQEKLLITVEAQNQQLTASEQQLKASNQQLSANEQQLRASNQQANALNQQLIASQRELSLKNEELQSIVYISSHDLKTPLVNINGFSELLIEHCDEMKELINKCDMDADTQKEITSLLNEDIPTDLEYISTSAQRMKRLIEGLLRVSRIGTVGIKAQEINMNDLVAEIMNNVKYKTQDLDAEIVLEDLPDCTGDKHQITQVFTNLIDNALKYLSPDRKGRIKITGKTKNKKSIYCVEDNGIGIKPAYYDKIFEIYHRLNPRTSTEGDGLGLTIVRRILDRHKGTIRVESEPEKGSKFFISIPTE